MSNPINTAASPAANRSAKLAGKVALVTGASKGIGAGIAKELAAQGASVVVNYASSAAGAQRVVDAITQAGGKAIAVQADIADPAALERLFAAAKEAYGHLDILVNNAGVYAFGPIETVTKEAISAMFETNVTGLLLATKAALALFPAGSGNIINIGSVVGEMPPPGAAIYVGTKGAVNSITRSLAKELGPKGIRVNAINPGVVVTEGFKAAELEGDFEQFMISQTPLGRSGQPEDIATLVAFIASSDAGWVTGSLIDAAGGWR